MPKSKEHDDICKDLYSYLDHLKKKKSEENHGNLTKLSQKDLNLQSGNDGTVSDNSSTVEKVDTEHQSSSQEESLIIFPPNYEKVVECMTRNDLFNDPEKDTMLLDKKVGVNGYYPYFAFHHENFAFDNDDETKDQSPSNALLLFKMEENDRKLAQKEKVRQFHQKIFEEELDTINHELDDISIEYKKSHRVFPPGYFVGGSNSVSDTSTSSTSSSHNNLDAKKEKERETNSIENHHENSCTKKRNKRFFITDMLRSETTACSSSFSDSASFPSLGNQTEHNPIQSSSIREGDTNTESGFLHQQKSSTSPQKDNKILRNKLLAGKATALLTKDEELRLETIMEDFESSTGTTTFGSDEAMNKLLEIDTKLVEKGFFYNLDLTFVHPEPTDETKQHIKRTSDNKNTLTEFSQDRETKEKLQEINEALSALLSLNNMSPHPSTDDSGNTISGSSLSVPFSQDEILSVYQEAKTELEEDGILGSLAPREEIQHLISSIA